MRVYTIVIKLPAGDNSCSGDGHDGPTVKQYHGCYEECRRHGAVPARLSRRPSSSQDLRLPLNASKILQQHQPAATNCCRLQPRALHGSAAAVAAQQQQQQLHQQMQAKEKKKKKFQEKKSERKAAKTLSAILLTFIITWTPYNILVLLKPFTATAAVTAADDEDAAAAGKEWVSQGVWDFFYYLCYINSTINPVCYALCNATFRMTYVRILKCKWNTRRRQPPPPTHFRA